jgi:hypothetical protein
MPVRDLASSATHRSSQRFAAGDFALATFATPCRESLVRLVSTGYGCICISSDISTPSSWSEKERPLAKLEICLGTAPSASPIATYDERVHHGQSSLQRGDRGQRCSPVPGRTMATSRAGYQKPPTMKIWLDDLRHTRTPAGCAVEPSWRRSRCPNRRGHRALARWRLGTTPPNRSKPGIQSWCGLMRLAWEVAVHGASDSCDPAAREAET